MTSFLSSGTSLQPVFNVKAMRNLNDLNLIMDFLSNTTPWLHPPLYVFSIIFSSSFRWSTNSFCSWWVSFFLGLHLICIMPHERAHSHWASGPSRGSFSQRPIPSLSSSDSDSTLLSANSQVEVDHLTSLQPENASWGRAIVEEEHTSNFQIEE